MPAATLSPETKERALALLREAIAAAERLQEAQRTRWMIGTYARDLGLVEPVGHYGRAEIEAVEREPEWLQARKELADIDAAALERLHAGDFAGARETYRSGASLRQGVLYLPDDFFGWLLDMDGADLALNFYRSDDWAKVYGRSKTSSWLLRDVSSLAKAFIVAGRRMEGLQLLEEYGASADAIGDHEALAIIGRALWVAGETTDGRNLLRRAARAALPIAAWRLDSVVSVVADLCWINDNDEVVEHLRRLLKMAPPTSQEDRDRWWDETFVPAKVAGRTFMAIADPGLQGEENWERGSVPLTQALAWAGLDEEASFVLASLPDHQPDLLIAVVEGKAMRGRFTEALQIAAQADADQVLLAGPRSVMRHAARSGDAQMFKHAWAMRSDDLSYTSYRDLTELAHAGQVDAAVECARTVHVSEVPRALLSVVVGLTNVGRVRSSGVQDEFYL